MLKKTLILLGILTLPQMAYAQSITVPNYDAEKYQIQQVLENYQGTINNDYKKDSNYYQETEYETYQENEWRNSFYQETENNNNQTHRGLLGNREKQTTTQTSFQFISNKVSDDKTEVSSYNLNKSSFN